MSNTGPAVYRAPDPQFPITPGWVWSALTAAGYPSERWSGGGATLLAYLASCSINNAPKLGSGLDGGEALYALLNGVPHPAVTSTMVNGPWTGASDADDIDTFVLRVAFGDDDYLERSGLLSHQWMSSEVRADLYRLYAAMPSRTTADKQRFLWGTWVSDVRVAVAADKNTRDLPAALRAITREALVDSWADEISRHPFLPTIRRRIVITLAALDENFASKAAASR